MKILCFSPFPTYPPEFGGQTRTYSLNKELSRKHDVFQFSIVLGRYKNNENKMALKSWETQINRRYREYNYLHPLPLFLSATFYKLGLNSLILSSPTLSLLNPKIVVKEQLNCDIIQVEGPYLFNWVYKQAIKNPLRKPIVLVEHNVEYQRERSIRRKLCSFFSIRIVEMEKLAVRYADAIFTVSERDAEILKSLYDIDKRKVHIIPNGVDPNKFYPVSEAVKVQIKGLLNFSGKKIVLFSGSLCQPNIEAVKVIQGIAEQMEREDVVFLVSGSVGEKFRKTQNVVFTGYVEDILPYFQMADVAINPVTSGSGTNLKMLEYLACGLPTITTEFGARGLEVGKKHVIIAPLESFPEKILELLGDEVLSRRLSENGKKLVEEKYTWSRIADKVSRIYESIA